MSNDNDQQPPKKLSKYERERAMYEKLGMQHPKDTVFEFKLRFVRGISERQRIRDCTQDVDRQTGDAGPMPPCK